MEPQNTDTTTISSPVATSGGELTLADFVSSSKDWFIYLLKKWWIILPVAILGGLLGIYIASKDVAKYESRISFALDDGSGDGGSGVSSIAAQFGFNIGGGGHSFFAGDNILEIMKSRRIVESVLLSTDTINGKVARLIQHYLDFQPKKTDNDITSKVNFPTATDKTKFTYLQDSVLYIIANTFSTTLIQAQKPDKKLDIYEVRVTSPNEHFTKVFTDRIVQETINFYTELRSKKGRETLTILEQRVGSMKGNMNASIATKSSIQDANLNPAFAAAQAPLQTQSANIQVYSGAYAEMFKNLELARFQYLKDIPLLQIIDAADYPMNKIKKGKFKEGMLFSIITFLLIIGILVAIKTVTDSLYKR